MWLWFYAFVLDFRLFVGKIIIVTKGFGQDYPFCFTSLAGPPEPGCLTCPNLCQTIQITRQKCLNLSIYQILQLTGKVEMELDQVHLACQT